jgi:hypothetical protein
MRGAINAPLFLFNIVIIMSIKSATIRYSLWLVIMIGVIQANAQSKDTLFFTNKSMLIGELISIKLGRIEFDGDGVGIVKVKYDKVSTIQASKHYFRIETVQRDIIPGFIEASVNRGKIIAKTAYESKEIAIGDIASMFKFGTKWSTRINGNVGAGYTYTKSSQIGRFNADGAIFYHNEKTEVELGGNMIFTSDSVTSVVERANLNLRYNYYFSKYLFGVALVNYQRNTELGLNKRWQQALALGYKFLLTRHSQGVVITGLAINREQDLKLNSTNNQEWIVQGKYNFFSFSKPNISLGTTQTLYFSLSQKGRTRYDGDINLNWELISDFSLSLNFYNNYDSKSPTTGGARSDYGFVAGLSYKF